MPIGPWSSSMECARHFRDSGRYSEEVAKELCSKLEQQLTNKFDGWIEEKAWEENERLFEGYITADKIDNQLMRIPLEQSIKAMPDYMRTGKLMDGHTNQIRGEPLAWKVVKNRILVKFGVYSRMEGDDKFWERVKLMGEKGGMSIGGEPGGGKRIVCRDGVCHLETKSVNFFEVSFVDNKPANTGARVTDVNTMAKGEDQDAITKRMTWDECIAHARSNPKISDPDRFCAWLKWYGPHGEKKTEGFLGRMDFSLSEDELDMVMDSCGNCRKAIEQLVTDGYTEDDARVEVKAWLASLVTATQGDDTLNDKEIEAIAKKVVELQKQEEAPAETPPPEEGEGGEERDLGKELDELKAQIAKLADAVSSALGKVESETEAPVEEEAEEAEEVAADVEEEKPAETPPAEGETAAEKQLAKEREELAKVKKDVETLRKSLEEPARGPRGRVPQKPGAGGAETFTTVAELVVKSVNAGSIQTGRGGVPNAVILTEGVDKVLES